MQTFSANVIQPLCFKVNPSTGGPFLFLEIKLNITTSISSNAITTTIIIICC